VKQPQGTPLQQRNAEMIREAIAGVLFCAIWPMLAVLVWGFV